MAASAQLPRAIEHCMARVVRGRREEQRPDPRACRCRARCREATTRLDAARARGGEMRKEAVVAEAQRHGIGRRAEDGVGAESSRAGTMVKPRAARMRREQRADLGPVRPAARRPAPSAWPRPCGASRCAAPPTAAVCPSLAQSAGNAGGHSARRVRQPRRIDGHDQNPQPDRANRGSAPQHVFQHGERQSCRSAGGSAAQALLGVRGIFHRHHGPESCARRSSTARRESIRGCEHVARQRLAILERLHQRVP